MGEVGKEFKILARIFDKTQQIWTPSCRWKQNT